MAREILTVAQMAQADQAAIDAGGSLQALMQKAGDAVADAVCARYATGSVLVLAGPGNNGGDGYVTATTLRSRGWSVEVQALAAPKTEAAKAAAAIWGRPVNTLGAAPAEGVLIIDALFGAGLSRTMDGEAARMARRLARTGATVVAIDIPSGVNGDTGAAPEKACFTAHLTVTFHRRKPAHVLQPGRAHCGEVIVADIGLNEAHSSLRENDPELWLERFPWPGVATHKHSRGHLVVISGEAWNTGAARLAARAGLRVGAGLVTLMSPPEALMVNAAHLEAIMLVPFDTETDLENAAADVEAAVIGPAAGVNDGTLSNVLALARTGAALVVDADALSVFQGEPEELFNVLDRDDVLTPHPGEFERLFPGMLRNSPERISAARDAARRAQAVVLLKGADTVIAAPDGRAVVNLNGSPWLATAGSGDVLAGLIGGLIAQGMDSFHAACAGAWIHGACGEAFGAGLISEDLPDLVPRVLKSLWARVASPLKREST